MEKQSHVRDAAGVSLETKPEAQGGAWWGVRGQAWQGLAAAPRSSGFALMSLGSH